MPSFSSSDHLWSLIKSYEETCRALRETRSELAGLQQKESQLEAQCSSQHAMLIKLSQPAKERVFSTFDVLQQILAYAIEPTTYDDSEDFIYTDTELTVLPTVFAVASVSTLWRSTALRSPQLWQRIYYFGRGEIPRHHTACVVHRVKCCLRRSFPLSLIIRWEDITAEDQPSSWPKSLFETIALHSHRWQVAKLRLPFAHYRSFFPLRMPKVEALTLQDTGGDTLVPMLGSMPLLRTLALLSPNFSSIEFPWHQLTAVSVLETARMEDPTLKRCQHVERLYIKLNNLMGLVDPVSLADLRHLTVRHNLALFPWSTLTTPTLESLTFAYNYFSVPQSDALQQFLERCPRLHLLQIALTQLHPESANLTMEPFFEMSFPTTVRILQLKLSTGTKYIHHLLSFLNLQRLKKQLPDLQQVHVDITHLFAESTGDLILHTVLTVSTDIEQHHSIYGAPSSLQMVYLHASSFHQNLLSTMNFASPHLKVTSKPLKFETQGESHFPVGHLLSFED